MKLNVNNRKALVCLVISAIIAVLFILLVNFDLIKALYEMYYGDSQIDEFFKEQGQNVFNNNVRITAFKFLISRGIYSTIPLVIVNLITSYYHTKKLPDKLLDYKLFKDNPSLDKILMIARYLIGVGLFSLVISFKRPFFYSTFHNCLIGYKPDFLRICLASLAFLITIIDWTRFFDDLKSFPQRHNKLFSLLFILFISIVSCCLVEFQIGSKMYILEYMIHVSVMYWIILQLIFLAIFRNVKPGAIVSLVFAYVIGLANDIVYQFRGNYIMFGDITVVRTAFEVAGNYDYNPGFWFWLSLGILIASIIIVVIVKMPKEAFSSTSTFRRVISTIIVEIIIAAFIVITFKTGDFYGKVFGVGWDYNENVSVVGYLPYFFSNMDSTTRIEVPDYSPDRAYEILDNVDDSEVDNKASSVNEPNIILIQNEAFSDLSILADIETDVDPLTYIHSMSENTEKGYLNMSVTGGPTSNTEFEVLSRTSLQFFPYGSVPYTQYLKQHIPSIVEVLKHQENPYHTVAYHSYYSSGYNRNSVYDYMGFDEKLFENNFLNEYQESDIPRGYLTDEVDYQRVIKVYEDNKNSDNPFFCFNVTIQGHGGYTGGPFDLPEKVNVTNFKATDSINTYLSLIKMSDTAFKGLIEYFSSVDEPTIIMMYGDHQPTFDDEAKELLGKHPAWADESLQNLSQFYVPYIIWANFDIEEVDKLKEWNVKAEDYFKSADKEHQLNSLSTNYVGSYLLEKSGVKLSDYDRYLLNLRKNIPAMTAIGIWDDKNNYYPNASACIYSDQLKELEIVQYNLIFEKNNRNDESYLP